MTKEDTSEAPSGDPAAEGVQDAAPDVPPLDIDAVARMAWIALSDEERARFGAQLSQVLEHVGVLDELESDEDEAEAAPALVNVLRPDAARERRSGPGSRPVGQASLEGAPARDGDYFATPRVLD